MRRLDLFHGVSPRTLQTQQGFLREEGVQVITQQDMNWQPVAGPGAVRNWTRDRLGRLLTVFLVGLMIAAGFGIAQPEAARAGQAGTINSNNVEVFRHLNDHTVIDYVHSGDRVDIFWGPEGEMFEINHGGTVGWVWAEFVDLDGSGGSSSGSSSSSSSSSSGGSSSTPRPCPARAGRA